MKILGFILIGVGALYLLYAFNMDVSVTVPTTYFPGVGSIGGQEVANIDLMARRQNHLSVAGLITFIGVMMAIFGKDGAERGSVNNTDFSSRLSSDFDGVRDINSDAYRLWLSKFYQIERNDVFGRYVIAEQTFTSLDDALMFAHTQEEEKLGAKIAFEERRNAQNAADIESARVAAEQAEAEWQERKPKFVIGIVIILALAAGSYFVFRESPEERTARLAREEIEKIEMVQGIENRFGITLPKDATAIEIIEKAELYPFYCNEETDGTLLQFDTGITEKEVQNLLAKSLGKGERKYDGLDENFDWKWQKGKVRYELSMHNEQPPIAVNFCMLEGYE